MDERKSLPRAIQELSFVGGNACSILGVLHDPHEGLKAATSEKVNSAKVS
jgi:hypothetical protein